MIAILKYNAGNIRSVENALLRLGYSPVISDDAGVLASAEKVIIPGVGEASSAMRYLREKELDRVICELRQPVLGICLGLQLLCQSSEEGDTACLGIFPAAVKKFPAEGIIPHMGWNTLHETLQDVYFVHSYYAEICSFTVQTCTYIVPFSAALRKDNFYALQYHPEKSGSTGAVILEQFLKQ